MAKLLEQSLDELPDELTRAVFYAFGAFSTPSATPEMLALYLDETLDDTNETYSDAFWHNEPTPTIELENLKSIETALNTLHTAGLAGRIPAETQGGYPYSVLYYRIHDIAHAYAASQHPDPAKMVSACLAYSWRHNQPSHENFSALRPELENFMGASASAMVQARWGDVEQFAWNLYPIGGSRFVNFQGYYLQAQILLERAAEAAGKRGDKRAQGGHLGNLGLAYKNLGDYAQAIDYHKQHLAICEEIGDKQGKGNALGNLGLAYYALGDTPQAIDYHQQRLAIAEEIGDKQGKGNALGNLGIAYEHLGDTPQAIAYHQQALAISREIGDKRAEGSILGNLGLAYEKLGDRETALDYYRQALDVGRQIGDRHGIARHLYNMALLLNDLTRYAEAIRLLEESLNLFRAMGLAHEIPDVERALARARAGLAGAGDAP